MAQSRFWRSFRRNKLGMAGLILSALICVTSLLAPFLAPFPYDAQFINTGLTELGAPVPPGSPLDEVITYDGKDRHYEGTFLLGTDRMGRDVLSRLWWGSQVSLVVGFAATLAAAIVGLVIGLVSGYFGGWVDTVLQRFTDFVLSFPYLLFVIALATLLGQNAQFRNWLSGLQGILERVFSVLGPKSADAAGNLTASFIVLLAIAVLGWTSAARVVRGKTLSIKEKDFVEAARSTGAGPFYIIRKHILPNVIGPLIVLASMGVAATILAESTLSYLGFGVTSPIPSWGNMIQDGQAYFRTAPWLVVYPGLCILLVVLGFNLLGDGLRDIMDPRESGERARLDLPFLRWAWAVPIVFLGGIFVIGRASSEPAHLIEAKPGARSLYGGILRTCVTDSLRTMDPAIAYDTETAMAIHLMFDSLLDYGRFTADLVPGAAERWDVSADGLIYTFHLRKNIMFHNGRACTAEDYKYSFERLLWPETNSPASSFYNVIAGARDMLDGKTRFCSGITTPDPYTIVIRLERPRHVFPYIIAMPFGSAVAREEVERWGEDIGSHPVGTGPFKLKDWRRGDRAEWVRWEKYFLPGLPYLDGIVLEEGVTRELAAMRFMQGKYDTVNRITSPDYLFFKTDPQWNPALILEPSSNVYGELLNQDFPPFDNLKVRQALNWAVNKEKLIKLRNGRNTIAKGVIPPIMPGFNPDLIGYGFDPAKAKALLAEAGYPNGLPQPLTYWHLSDEAGTQTGQSIQADLKAVGVQVDLHPVAFNTYLSAVGKRGTVPFGYTAWFQDYPDPSNFLEPKFHGSYIADENSSNDVYVDDPEVNQLLDEASSELDADRRVALYRAAEQRIVDQAYWIFTYHSLETELVQPYLQGPNGYRLHPVWPRAYRDVAFVERADGVKIHNQREAP